MLSHAHHDPFPTETPTTHSVHFWCKPSEQTGNRTTVLHATHTQSDNIANVTEHASQQCSGWQTIVDLGEAATPHFPTATSSHHALQWTGVAPHNAKHPIEPYMHA